MAKKRSILLVIMGMIFGCLLATGIFAVVTKSVSFNLALKLDPQIYFSLSMRIDYDGDGYNADEVYNEIAIDETKNYTIFDNKTGADVVSWATVNQNSIVLNQVMAGNILKGLTVNSRFEITVTNLTETTATEYLNLTLDYDGSKEVFKSENGYGAVNMRYGVASGEYAATKTFEIIPQTALLNGYIEVPFKAEIDTELRYTATITTENCEVVSAPTTFKKNQSYTAEFSAPNIFDPIFTYQIQVGTTNIASTSSSEILQIPYEQVTDNLTIKAIVVEPVRDFSTTAWDGSVAPSFPAGNGTAQHPFEIYNGKHLALMMHLLNNAGTASYYSGSATLNGKTTENIEQNCDISTTFQYAHYEFKNDIILNASYANWESWTTSTTGLNIFSGADKFYGHLNGNGYTILGWFKKANWTGLFYIICAGAVVENVNLNKGFIAGNDGGGIAWRCGGSILNCSNGNSIISTMLASNLSSGGIVGRLELGGVVSSCGNFGDIVVNTDYNVDYIGGIVGACLTESVITNCYNTGDITVNHTSGWVGGVAGLLGASSPKGNGMIKNCYSTGAVTGGDCRGEIVGFKINSANCIINSYCLTSSAIGGSTSNSYLLSNATYEGWDFINVWGWIDDYDYPVLRAFNPDARLAKI